MFRSIEDFQKTWQVESENSLKILHALTDTSLGQRVTPDGRTLGRLAWHLVQSQVDMMTKTGLKVDGPAWETPIPATASEIVNAYEQVAKEVANAVQRQWTEASLLELNDLYGETWANGLTLSILIRHEVHHRAQMTVLMRQAGLVVPGVYGPAREEWASYGMDAME